MGWACVTMGIACGAAQGWAIGAAIGETVPIALYGAGQAGAHGGGQAGAQVATGAAYTGAGGQHVGWRLNQLHGQQGQSRVVVGQQQPAGIASAATASRISNLFISCVSSQSSWGITAWVASSDFPIQTLRGGASI
jgi:hypothetical protein